MKMQIGYLGPEGTFSWKSAFTDFEDLCARVAGVKNDADLRRILPQYSLTTAKEYVEKLKDGFELVPFEPISAVIEAVDENKVEAAVLPLENLLKGYITETLDAFNNKNVTISSESILPIHVCIAVSQSYSGEKIETIISKGDVFPQCSKFLKQKFSDARREVRNSTATSFRELAEEGSRGKAGLGSEKGAIKYGLKVLYKNIEDEPDNITRFILINKLETEPTRYDRTLVAIKPYENWPGLLYNILEPWALEKIDITMALPRPTRKQMGRNIFLIDFVGHQKDELVKKVLDATKKKWETKVLGSWPKKI